MWLSGNRGTEGALHIRSRERRDCRGRLPSPEAAVPRRMRRSDPLPVASGFSISGNGGLEVRVHCRGLFPGTQAAGCGGSHHATSHPAAAFWNSGARVRLAPRVPAWHKGAWGPLSWTDPARRAVLDVAGAFSLRSDAGDNIGPLRSSDSRSSLEWSARRIRRRNGARADTSGRPPHSNARSDR